MTSRAILIRNHGGPEVLELVDREVPGPGPGEVQIRHAAVGVNFIDIYIRTGLYPAPGGLPYIAGKEGAGTVIALGEGVSDFQIGDRVAYPGTDGAYSEVRNIEARHLVRVPDAISFESAAAMMMKGMTAEYLLNRTFKVGPGTTLLFHAAAGGVGLIAGQWAKALGATVIGTAGSADKVKLALEHGYDHVINYREENFAERVRALTGGKGVDVVYDSVGADTFPNSLDCLKPRGMWVSFGQSSGPIAPINIGLLMQKGSLFATRPTLGNYIATPEDLKACADSLFGMVESGKVEIRIGQTYPLDNVGQAHTDLAERRTSGTTLLIP